jgi:hypothetical protein
MKRWAQRLTHPTIGTTIHTAGIGGARLPVPQLLVIETRSDGYFLIRYTDGGAFAGDTWHESFEDAVSQSQFEFGAADWTEVPEAEPDAVRFARSLA